MKAVKLSLPSGTKYVKSLLFGIITGALICVMLLALITLLLSKSGLLPTEYLWIVITVILAISGFCGGYISARIYKSQGLLLGMITGLVLFLILTIGSSMGYSGEITAFLLYKALALIIG